MADLDHHPLEVTEIVLERLRLMAMKRFSVRAIEFSRVEEWHNLIADEWVCAVEMTLFGVLGPERVATATATVSIQVPRDAWQALKECIYLWVLRWPRIGNRVNYWLVRRWPVITRCISETKTVRRAVVAAEVLKEWPPGMRLPDRFQKYVRIALLDSPLPF